MNGKPLGVETVGNLIVSIEAMGALPKDGAELLRERTKTFQLTPKAQALLNKTLNAWESVGGKEEQ